MSTDTVPVDPANAEQLAAWNGDEGTYWAQHAERFDRAIAGHDGPFQAAAGFQPADRVLDVGCGHGLMLIAAAKKLRTGKAIGVDLWQTEDQAANNPDATLLNARLEGVAERIELKTADARQLPFVDKSFDVVLSSWALHNIYDAAGREQAIAEIARVLKPGGQAAICARAQKTWIYRKSQRTKLYFHHSITSAARSEKRFCPGSPRIGRTIPIQWNMP